MFLLALTIACGSESGSGGETASPPTSTPIAASSTPRPSITPRLPTPAPTEVEPTSTQSIEATATRPPAPTTPAPTLQPQQAVTISVSAMNLAFDRDAISVAANTLVTVIFTNNDAAVPHDFGVSVPFVPHSDTCSGPCSASITFDSGPPGSYSFQCSIHPEMVGTFVVE